MSYTDGYIATHYSKKDALKLFKDFNVEKLHVVTQAYRV